MPPALRQAARLTLDLLFPPQCAVCRRPGAMICAPCHGALPVAGGARCERCWTPVGRDSVCVHCHEVAPSFAAVRSPYVMDGGARTLVHRLKYDGLTALAEPMASLMAPVIDARQFDLVAPVPLHRGRERARGYNQSAELAAQLARALGAPCDARAARRIRATAPLVKAMSREERRAIVAGAFSARTERVDGRRVLLVDDVTTTGATLDECASALLAGGACDVRCVTFARA